MKRPVAFAENNVVNTVRLLEAMRAPACGASSSPPRATVYGTRKRLPLREDDPVSAAVEPLRRHEGGGRGVHGRLPQPARLRRDGAALLQPLRPQRAV